MLVLISLNIVLLEAQSCTYNPDVRDCVADYSFVFSLCTWEPEEGNCFYVTNFCNQMEPAYANEANCPKLSVRNIKNKCIQLLFALS